MSDEQPMETDPPVVPEIQKETWSKVLGILEPLTDNWYELGVHLEVETSFLHELEKKPKEERLMEVALKVWKSGIDEKCIMDKMSGFSKEVAEKLMDVVQDEANRNKTSDNTDTPEEGKGQEKTDEEPKDQEEATKVDAMDMELTPPNQEATESKDDSATEPEKTESETTPPTESEATPPTDSRATPPTDSAVTPPVESGATPPDIETQKKEIQAALRQQLKKGDTWYLVDIRWMKQWKKYVGYDTWDQSNAGKESADPGPLDNSGLFKDESLRDHLMDELDYYLLPESAWNKLSSWYSLSTGSKVISRRVVEYGLYMKHCKVEVYLLEFKMCVHPHLNDIKKREFSRADTVADLEKVLREEFEIPSSVDCRVWHRYMTHTYELLSRADQTLQDAGLYNGQTIVLEKKNEDGSWPRTTSTVSTTNHSTRSSDDFSSSTSSRSTGSSYTTGGYGWSSYSSQKPSHPGLCGLSNLGNTCFMNSALQCLSNTAPLTEYFLGTEAGYHPYKKHINKDNPLGMGGAIAEAYGTLLEEIWGGKVSVTAPRQFKTQVGRYAPQFVGYAQHDSQELLAFLLDGLHEDLNLIRKKPYVDMTIETKGRKETEVAEETWYKYLQRNQSVIVKFFQGQLRSTLVCPNSECRGVSKTFDPFMFLSLPLPIKKTRSISVYLVRTDPMALIVKYKLKLPKRGNVGDLKEELGKLAGVKDTHLAVVDVYNSRFHRIYSDRDPLSHIMDRDDIYCYELTPDSEGSKRKMVHVPVYMRVESDRHYQYSSRYYNLFGLPTVAYVPAECTYRTLYTAIVSRMGRYVKLWAEVKGQESSKEQGSTAEESTEENGNLNNQNETQNNENVNETSDDGNEAADSENQKSNNESSADPTEEGEKMETNEKTIEAANNEEKNKDEKEKNEDIGERDLFRLVVVNSYGSQEIKKLVDDPKKPLQLTGSTYIACDWDTEVQEKCYDEEAIKEYEEDGSCRDEGMDKKKNIQLMDCFELFNVEETLGKDDEWYCPNCKDHVRASKKFDLWKLPDTLVVHLKRFSYDRYWRDKLDVLVDFPVNGLDLSSLVRCPGSPEAVYDLYAVSNHFGGMGGGHYTAYAKNKETNKWHNFDDSHVSETSEDRLVTAAAYVLFYRRRVTQAQPIRRSVLDRSLSQSFAEEDKELTAKYKGGDKDEKKDKNKIDEVFQEKETTSTSMDATSTSMDEPD